MKTYTLRRKLLKSITIPLILYIAVIGALGYYGANDEIGEVYDTQLITAANVLWFLSQKDLQEKQTGAGSIDIDDFILSGDAKIAFNEYADLRMFRVWKNDKLFVYSANSIPVSYKRFKQGFTDFKYEHKKWRVYSLHVPDQNVIIEVAEEYEARKGLVSNIILDLVLPALILLPLILFLFSRALGYGLFGLKKIAGEIEARSPADMSPLIINEAPEDLLPLTRAIDSLFLRIKIALKREREFIDNAAHSLKTPLAALKIQAQLLDKLDNEKEKETVVKDLLKSTDRASRLVEQLLISSRIENHKYDQTPVPVYLSLSNSVRLTNLVAQKKAVKISLAKPDTEIIINGDDELLSILFTNILDNAVKYSPQKGEVYVKLYKKEKTALIEISDQGPGIGENEKEKIIERFQQAGKNPKTGNGLGLSIAKQIVDLLNGNIAITNLPAGKGLKVTITFNIS